jgi:hypothetical protein
VLTNKGYIIEADNVIYVTARVIRKWKSSRALFQKDWLLLALSIELSIHKYRHQPHEFSSSYIHICLGTENNTLIKFSGIKAGVSLINSGGANLQMLVLNSEESYVLAVKGPTEAIETD